ncbi:MAG: hypothetical protein QMB20_00485 [Flavobacteriales bacterium]|jgi:hypothetical protein|tara:strand:- start:2718 stop:3059 length:342 start_codon:yes stop_codon:yes gene_type:complete
MTNLSKKNELASNSDLRLVALQLQKDFMMFAEDIEVEEIQTFEALEKMIFAEVSELLRRNKSKLTQIIYRIDIPEKAISEALHPENEEGFERAISRLMVKRTQLKIEIRKSMS